MKRINTKIKNIGWSVGIFFTMVLFVECRKPDNFIEVDPVFPELPIKDTCLTQAKKILPLQVLDTTGIVYTQSTVSINEKKQFIQIYKSKENSESDNSIDRDKMYYLNGYIDNFNKRHQRDSIDFKENGFYPSVAIDDQGWVVSIFVASDEAKMLYKIGKWDESSYSIKWDTPVRFNVYDSDKVGATALAMNNTGELVLFLHIPETNKLIEVSGIFDQGSKTISFGEVKEKGELVKGASFSVDINEDGDVIRTLDAINVGNVFYETGEFNRQEKKVIWSDDIQILEERAVGGSAYFYGEKEFLVSYQDVFNQLTWYIRDFTREQDCEENYVKYVYGLGERSKIAISGDYIFTSYFSDLPEEEDPCDDPDNPDCEEDPCDDPDNPDCEEDPCDDPDNPDCEEDPCDDPDNPDCEEDPCDDPDNPDCEEDDDDEEEPEPNFALMGIISKIYK